jgi:toxin ParE1/3/4
MPRRTILRDAARRDIVSIAGYISGDSPRNAERFLDNVAASIDLLLENPQIGTLRDSPRVELIGLRHWPVKRFTKYLIFYRELSDGIDVIRVLHGAMDLPAILDENTVQNSGD